jgi:hypothetical protein
MFLEITLMFAAGLGNLAWDLTGRRVSARARRQARRARRRDSLPLPAAGEDAADPFAAIVGLAPDPFVEQTRVIAEELDRVVDHFDLVLLRAEAGESLIGDVVYIGAEAPRERARELLRSWLELVAELPVDLAERLRDLGLPDRTLAELLTREHQRSYWPHAATSRELLQASASDFEGAVILLGSFLRTLTLAGADPYR